MDFAFIYSPQNLRRIPEAGEGAKRQLSIMRVALCLPLLPPCEYYLAQYTAKLHIETTKARLVAGLVFFKRSYLSGYDSCLGDFKRFYQFSTNI
jgi:hypothetical protein